LPIQQFVAGCVAIQSPTLQGFVKTPIQQVHVKHGCHTPVNAAGV
jgi:hypothetical protein